MKIDDITNRLSEKQKQRLREAKTSEDLNSLFTSDKLLLTEDQLGSVAGGTCFTPSDVELVCPDCGETYYEMDGHVCLTPQTYRTID